MSITAGKRMRSRVCETEVVVIRVPQSPIVLHCGGVPMAGYDDTVEPLTDPALNWNAGSSLGKRYTSAHDDSLEVLVTKAGRGTLGDGTEPLVIKASKPLPSSD